MNRKIYAASLVMVMLTSFLVGCGGTASAKSNLPPRLQKIQQAGKLVVGTAITRPFEYRSTDTNELVGFDVDLVNKIASRLNVPVEWKEMAFADLLTELQAGNVDMVIAAMYITPKRKEIADFSNQYLATGLVMVLRKDNPTTIKDVNDLAGRTVGVKKNATGETWADDLYNNKKIALEVRRYTDTLTSLDDLNNGLLDAVFNDKLNTLEYMKTHPNVYIQGDVFAPAGLGMAVQKGDTDLLTFLNQTLQNLQTSGEIDALYGRWFNVSASSK